MRLRSFSLLSLVVAIAACGEDEVRECRVGADCASGQCSVDGRCVTVSPGQGDAGTDATGANDGASDGPSESSTDAALPGCTPNKDGTITRDEIPIKTGLKATYRVALDETVSTAGTPGNDRVWDFSIPFASDTSVLVETQALAGKWFAADFPTATYASKLREGNDLLGIFETKPASFVLLGVASTADGFGSTKLKNAPPVDVIQFPLKLGATWTIDTSVSGTLSGVPGVYSEKYVSKVDARGTLKTPLGSFDVLRVSTVLTRTQALLVTTLRSFAFVTECYGTVATVSSQSNETEAEFTRAAELRRIAP